MPQEKILPHNLEAERAVLAAMVMDREAANVGIEMLSSGGFYSTSHQKIFDAICELYTSDHQGVDLTSLSESLRRKGELEAIGGLPALAELLQSVATSANVEYHAQIVREKALTRELIKSCSQLAERGFADSDDVANLLEDAEKTIFSLAEKRTTRGFQPVSALMGEIMEDIEKTWRHKEAVTGVATGYAKLDALTSGLQKSNLVVLAARPSVGKTAFALNIAQNVAMKSKIPVGIFSLEMSADQIVRRILCAEAKVDLARVRSGYINKEDFGRLTQAANTLSQSPIYIDDSPGLNINEIRTRSRRLFSELRQLGLLVVDYIQLISTRERVENRQQEVSLISRSLKGIARDLDCPVLALSQLSRAIEKRDDPSPRLSDLRESGAIEQDADVVMFIHRDTMKKSSHQDDADSHDEEPEEAPTKLIIGKQRNGPTGFVELYFIKHYTRFESMSDRFADPGFGDSAPF